MLRTVSTRVTDGVTNLRRTLVRVVRTAIADVDRRAEQRYQIEQPAEVELGKRRTQVMVLNVSGGGALLSVEGAALGQSGRLHWSGLSAPAAFHVVAVQGTECHVCFDIDGAARRELAQRLERMHLRAA